MPTPGEFTEYNNYATEDIKSVADAKNILKLLNCDKSCLGIVDKEELIKCAVETLNSDACRSRSRSAKEWPAIEKINALEVVARIFKNRLERLEKKEKEKNVDEFKIGQHVILENLSDDELNGLSAYIVSVDEDFLFVIPTPNRGNWVKVKKTKCKLQPWKKFEFFPRDYYQLFPGCTLDESADGRYKRVVPTEIPRGISCKMDLNSGYKMYKK